MTAPTDRRTVRGHAITVWLSAVSAMLVLPSLTAGAEPSNCGSGVYGAPGYAYAGHASASVATGVRATITQVRVPTVEAGHVAAWVGVGGPTAGRGGEPVWLQVGLAALPRGRSMLYAEIQRPGRDTQLVSLAERIVVGERHDLAVSEIATRPGVWRVWVDGRPATAPITLQGSHGRWKPIVTAETWDGGAPTCNRFGYRFDGIRVTATPDGSWRTFRPGSTFRDRGHVIRPRASTVAYAFDAASA